MKDLYDLAQRQQLLQRYLNVETTAAEERRLLDFYRQNADSLTPEEEDVRLLLLSSRQTDEFLPSEEKAVEFDRLMSHRPLLRPLLWTASVAASLVVLFLATAHLLTGGKATADTSLDVADITSATNFAGEQVASFWLRPVGDATIVTKTRADGTSASYIVCPTDDEEGFHVVPINIEL